MRSTFQVTIFVLLAIGMALPLYAQKESGSIVGRVSDIDNLPLEGVTVTVSSPALIGGSSIAYTDNNGDYRFPVLPPGVYDVSAALEGFQTAVRKDVVVSVGKTITVNHAIGQTAGETLEISAETSLIDTSTPASSKTVDVGVIENLPKFSFALDLFTLTP
jgi:Carboxypeptidase regulatory-like domain